MKPSFVSGEELTARPTADLELTFASCTCEIVPTNFVVVMRYPFLVGFQQMYAVGVQFSRTFSHLTLNEKSAYNLYWAQPKSDPKDGLSSIRVLRVAMQWVHH